MLFDDVKNAVNLVKFLENDLGVPEKKSGHWLFWCCPFHAEKTPSFGVNTDNNTWRCFGACSAGGTIIDYFMRRHNLDNIGAANELAGLAGINLKTPAPATQPARQHRIQPPDIVNIYSEPPAVDWQQKAAIITQDCFVNLWHNDAANARRWLAKRGITEDCIERFQLGYSFGGELAGLYVERGITVPHIAGGNVYAVNVRRPVRPGEANKYKHIAGGKPGAAIFNGDSLQGASDCFVVEGELDAIALQGATGAAVITLGSKSARITPAGLRQILSVKRFFIATDAGEDDLAANIWLSIVGDRGRRVLPPGNCKDVCQAADAGFDLAQWADNLTG